MGGGSKSLPGGPLSQFPKKFPKNFPKFFSVSGFLRCVIPGHNYLVEGKDAYWVGAVALIGFQLYKFDGGIGVCAAGIGYLGEEFFAGGEGDGEEE